MDNENNWRDASTKPEQEGNYLVHLVEGDIVIARYNSLADDWYYLDQNDRYWYDCSNLVTHWMPLPKPPGEIDE